MNQTLCCICDPDSALSDRGKSAAEAPGQVQLGRLQDHDHQRSRAVHEICSGYAVFLRIWVHGYGCMRSFLRQWYMYVCPWSDRVYAVATTNLVLCALLEKRVSDVTLSRDAPQDEIPNTIQALQKIGLPTSRDSSQNMRCPRLMP